MASTLERGTKSGVNDRDKECESIHAIKRKSGESGAVCASRCDVGAALELLHSRCRGRSVVVCLGLFAK